MSMTVAIDHSKIHESQMYRLKILNTHPLILYYVMEGQKQLDE